MVYILLVVVVALLTNLAGAKINTLADFNGAVIGFGFIYLFPLMVHIRCAWNLHQLQQSREVGQEEPPHIDPSQSE